MSGDIDRSIWEHLEELATRLRRVLFIVVIATIAFMSIPSDLEGLLRLNLSDYKPLISTILEYIQESLLPEGVNLIAFNWLDTFYIYFLVAIILGIIVTFPYISYELYQFLNPALYPNEKKNVLTFILVVIALFSVGVVYAWIILLPTTFRVLYQLVYQSRVLPFFSVKDFYNMIAFGLIGSGLFYTFPVIIWMLVKVDLLEIEALKKNRKQLFVGLLIITAVFTPDPTPFTMLLMSVPFYFLYELTIQILNRMIPKQEDKIVNTGLMASKRLLESAITNPKKEDV